MKKHTLNGKDFIICPSQTPGEFWVAGADRIRARCVLASQIGRRYLITIEATMNRFVLAEFNTHRVLSRNSASSRAIPFSKRAETVDTKPAFPAVWAAEQKGMQGGEQIERTSAADAVWDRAAGQAVACARELAELGVHKSLCNRLLEPFTMQTVIMTTDEPTGFFEQRCNANAQPEMHLVALCIRAAWDWGVEHCQYLEPGQWHAPYLDDEDHAALAEIASADNGGKFDGGKYAQVCVSVSAARCARVSYLTHDGKRDPREDLRLFQRLSTARPPHYSPMEHTAQALPEHLHGTFPGNFSSAVQLRHFIEISVNPFAASLEV